MRWIELPDGAYINWDKATPFMIRYDSSSKEYAIYCAAGGKLQRVFSAKPREFLPEEARASVTLVTMMRMADTMEIPGHSDSSILTQEELTAMYNRISFNLWTASK